MAGKLLQLLELYMAALSSCIHILFSEIWDDVTLNFHSLGLIQYTLWSQSATGNCPETTAYQHCWIPFVWCLHLLTNLSAKKTIIVFKVRTARQPRPTAATALPRLFSGAPTDLHKHALYARDRQSIIRHLTAGLATYLRWINCTESTVIACSWLTWQ